jgi:hypothetical protein
MTVCDPGIKKAVDRGLTSSGVPGKETGWFELFDGSSRNDDSGQQHLFSNSPRRRCAGLPQGAFSGRVCETDPEESDAFRETACSCGGSW